GRKPAPTEVDEVRAADERRHADSQHELLLVEGGLEAQARHRARAQHALGGQLLDMRRELVEPWGRDPVADELEERRGLYLKLAAGMLGRIHDELAGELILDVNRRYNARAALFF